MRVCEPSPADGTWSLSITPTHSIQIEHYGASSFMQSGRCEATGADQADQCFEVPADLWRLNSSGSGTVRGTGGRCYSRPGQSALFQGPEIAAMGHPL